jgi:hypothetical protein
VFAMAEYTGNIWLKSEWPRPDLVIK